MKLSRLLLPTSILLLSCSNPPMEKVNADSTKVCVPQKAVVIDTTPRVTGIGGIFFFSDNVKNTRSWYKDNLGIDTTAYGATFEFRNGNRPDEINYLQWSPFRNGSKYFAPSKKDFMINYRVQNIEGLIRKFRANGVTICDSLETYDYGKFIHIMDNEGNKIELWEPVDHVLTSMGGKTVK